jgi:FAD/FMN-containing dehydrogenase
VTGTGEHGVGIGKKEYLVEELGEGTVEFMRTIKKAVDPLGILNPGKVSLHCIKHKQSPDIVQLYPDKP